MKNYLSWALIALLLVGIVFSSALVLADEDNTDLDEDDDDGTDGDSDDEASNDDDDNDSVISSGQNGERNEFRVENEGQKTKIKAQIKDDGEVEVEVEEEFEIELENDDNETGSGNKTKLKIRNRDRNETHREIKIMPDTASQVALARLRLKVCSAENNCTIVLKDVGQREGNRTGNETLNLTNVQFKYEMQAERHARILGLFKAKMQVRAEVDADTGEVKTFKPWWAFLASEKEE